MKSKVCCILMTLISVCIVYLQVTNIGEIDSIGVDSNIKYVDSNALFAKVDILNDCENTDTSDYLVNDEAIETKQGDYIVVNTEEVVEENKTTVSVNSQNEVLIGKMSGYGPDCYGCSGYLASGVYVGDGNVYYNDSEYGQVRIVAGDKKYKFGTIVRINDSILAIVLDRGGSIGIGKKFLFDLLYVTEAEANINGISYETKFEILRNGF